MIDPGTHAGTRDIHLHLEVPMSKKRPEPDEDHYEGDFESSGTEPEPSTEPSLEGGGYPNEAEPPYRVRPRNQAQLIGPRPRSKPSDIHLHLNVSVSVTLPGVNSAYSGDCETSGTDPEPKTEPSHEGGGYPIDAVSPPGAPSGS